MPISPKSTPAPGIPGFPPPFWSARDAALYLGDVRERLRDLPARSVQCCVTSPPYWGLRDYGTGTWEGGRADCDHVEGFTRGDTNKEGKKGALLQNGGVPAEYKYKYKCVKCGAKRTDHQLGAEDVADCLGWATGAKCGGCFVCHMVEVFAEVRRVLRDDGTLWLNLGDTFDGGQGMIPAAVAMALRADGWKLVQDIIWYSPNKMPESVTNRCTKSHEHIFLLAKGDEYYFDHVAIQEEGKSKPSARLPANGQGIDEMHDGTKGGKSAGSDDIVNKRDVWVVPTKGYTGAHFATFSPDLIIPCILAGTSEAGCCVGCGAPYERVITRGLSDPSFLPDSDKDKLDVSGKSAAANASRSNRAPKDRDRSFDWSRNGKPGTNSTLDGTIAKRETLGWRKVCGCQASETAPCVVLDPFTGSGTTVATSLELGRAGVGIDLSENYLRENAIPRIEAAMRGEKVTRRAVQIMPPCKPPLPEVLR